MRFADWVQRSRASVKIIHSILRRYKVYTTWQGALKIADGFVDGVLLRERGRSKGETAREQHQQHCWIPPSSPRPAAQFSVRCRHWDARDGERRARICSSGQSLVARESWTREGRVRASTLYTVLSLSLSLSLPPSLSLSLSLSLCVCVRVCVCVGSHIPSSV